MSDFLQKLIEFLREFFPFTVIHTYEQGVKFRFGKDIGELPAGIWFRIPFFEEIHDVPIAEQTKNLLTQSVTTADGLVITFSANIVYKINSARQMYVAVHDFDRSLEAAAMIHLAKQIRTKTWEELRQPDEVKKLEQSLERRLTTKLSPWGVEVLDCGFTDLVQARAFRLFGDPGVHF